MKKSLMLVAISAIALGTVSSSALAATKTDTFNVQIVIRKTCNITTAATDIDLGIVDADAVNTSGTGTMSVKCSKNTAYTVGMTPSNANTGGAGSMAAQTAGNLDAVPYQLYSDAGYSAVWGNQAANDVDATGDGMLAAADLFTIYARAASADFVADTYIDTVTATVTY